jgi:hypothetical protein
MGDIITHNQFKASFDPAGRTMQLTLIKDGIELGSVEMDAREASRIAGIILGAAREAHRISGKPDQKSDKDDLTVIIPSGLNVAPGRKPDNVIAVFHFGETALGIELPNDNAQILAQRLMTSAAGGPPQ